MLGLLGYAVGALAMAFAQGLTAIIVFWAIIGGLGASLLLPSMQSLVHGNFQGAQRKRAYALVGAVLSVVGMGGIVLGILVWQEGGERVAGAPGARGDGAGVLAHQSHADGLADPARPAAVRVEGLHRGQAPRPPGGAARSPPRRPDRDPQLVADAPSAGPRAIGGRRGGGPRRRRCRRCTPVHAGWPARWGPVWPTRPRPPAARSPARAVWLLRRPDAQSRAAPRRRSRRRAELLAEWTTAGGVS